ncbi:PH domain-containing protein [candidate division WWE3 bacterium]|nr:PH domain-containing protein [candidate division WWE3 bacterium]
MLSGTLKVSAGIVFLTALLAISVYAIEKRLWKAKQYIITPESVDIIDTTFGARHNSYGLKGITSINLHQTPLSKLSDYGTITINFMGGSSVSIRNIPNPEKHLGLIQQLINKGEISTENLS